MGKSDFISAVKQKLLPNYGGGTPSSPNGNSISGKQPQASMASSEAIRLSIGQILAPGGTKSIEDISDQYWFSALQPIQPVGPPNYRPRQRAFSPGENLNWTPGDDKNGVTFEMLRALADGWDLLRIIIETRKDQLCAQPWEIRAKPAVGESNVDLKDRSLKDPNIRKLKAFFDYPDGSHNWKTWLRMWTEDMLVLDATALYYQRDLNGKIANVSPIDGGTICRLVTDLGTTPPPPSAAYQQVVYGSAVCDLTTDDLLYAIRNERTHKRYGYSPVEQIIVTIGIGLRKQQFLTEYYTSGNMPEALCFLPSTISPDRITTIQTWFDSVMAGDLSKRRRLTFLPGYGTGAGTDSVRPNIVFPKEVLLKDELDTWLMQIVCYAFSVSPQNLMKQMNRASAEQASTVAEEEGLEPAMIFVADICNQIIKDMGMDEGYEFAWQEQRDTDPVKAATVDNLLVGKIYTINEIREARGDDKRSEPQADMLGIFGPTGFIPLTDPSPAEQQQQQMEQQQQNQQQQQDFQTQQQQTQFEQQQQLAPPPPANKLAKIQRMDDIVPGIAIHPVFGDLSKLDKFFAYDPDQDTILVKGDVDLPSAYVRFRAEYPQYADKVPNA